MSILPVKEFTAKWDVTTQHLKQPTPTTWRKIAGVVWNVFSVLTVFPGLARLAGYGIRKIAPMAILPGQYKSNEDVELARQNFSNYWGVSEAQEDFSIEPWKIQTPDGVKLSAVLMRDRESTPHTPVGISFNGNCQLAKGKPLPEILLIAEKQRIISNFVVFDYRGVGDSEGRFQRTNDLLVDGSSIVQWVREGLKTPPKQIYFYGLSLGGAVAAETQALDAEHLTGPHINVSSFFSLNTMVQSIFGNTIGRLIGFALQWQGFSLDTARAFHKLRGRKLVVYHPEDGVICKAASLQEKVQHSDSLVLQTLPEREKDSNYFRHHGAPLSYYQGARERIGQFIFAPAHSQQEKEATESSLQCS